MTVDPVSGPVVVLGLGVSGRAAAELLVDEGCEIVVVDDSPTDEVRTWASDLRVDLVERPDAPWWDRQEVRASEIVVSPGVPARHRVFKGTSQVPVVGEIELASRRARCPIVAVTGTNGKTTVVSLVTDMLAESGILALAAGNIGLPLAAAVRRPAEVLVVEVSSFQLAMTSRFRPKVAAWLNFSADHLDWHPDMDHYRRSKARIFSNSGPGDVVVANLDDPTVTAEVMSVLDQGFELQSFRLSPAGRLSSRSLSSDITTAGSQEMPSGRGLSARPWTVEDGSLVDGHGREVVRLCDMMRTRPPDLQDALCAGAAAMAAGADLAAVRSVLENFTGLPHRMQLVGEADGVRYYDDSKATTPGAVLAGAEGCPSLVLIAGGRNKGLDLGVLADIRSEIRGVVAIGEAAEEITRVMRSRAKVIQAVSMRAAVEGAKTMARPGDAVVLSPACSSFDWYRSYAERGDDFARCVDELVRNETTRSAEFARGGRGDASAPQGPAEVAQ